MATHRLLMMMPTRPAVRAAIRVSVLALLCVHGSRTFAQRAPVADAEPVIVTSPAGTTEVGTLSGTPYRIDVPANWNHSLVVYFHGYSEGAYMYRADGPLNEQFVTGVDEVRARGSVIVGGPGWDGVPLPDGIERADSLDDALSLLLR